MKFIIGIDVACRAPHVAAGANQHGEIQWSGVRLRTRVEDLEELITRVPDEVHELVVVMEPTRNAWVPLASWLKRHGASVLVVHIVDERVRILSEGYALIGEATLDPTKNYQPVRRPQ